MESCQKQSSYEPIQTIGSGSFGKIARIRRRSDGNCNLVWKELDFTNMTTFEKKQVRTEINILHSLSKKRNPCIVQYHENITDMSGKTFIIMDYCRNGDLASYIESHKCNGTWTPESFIWKVLGQMTSALFECHRHKKSDDNANNTIMSTIIHRDIKPANILLDRSMNTKLCDFGLATEVLGVNTHPTINYEPEEGICGTPFYMAPERVNRCNYDERSDIWSLGCVLYELAALRHPFMAENETELASKINTGVYPEIPRSYSSDLRSTCAWMLRLDMTRRPTVEDIARMPQLQGTLREVKCSVRESELANKRIMYDREIARSRRELEEREKYIMSLECQLREREQNIRKRERELSSWEQQHTHQHQQHPPQDRRHESIFLPHLIDETSKDLSMRPPFDIKPVQQNRQQQQQYPPPCPYYQSPPGATAGRYVEQSPYTVIQDELRSSYNTPGSNQSFHSSQIGGQRFGSLSVMNCESIAPFGENQPPTKRRKSHEYRINAHSELSHNTDCPTVSCEGYRFHRPDTWITKSP